VPAPETWRDWVYIESGYVWLVWIGGLPFLLAFVAFVAVGMVCLWPIAVVRRNAIGAAALAAFAYLVVIATLMLLDPHLTIRGSADLFFPLLGLALLRVPDASPRMPAWSTRTGDVDGRSAAVRTTFAFPSAKRPAMRGSIFWNES
jgi:hypothetical protein